MERVRTVLGNKGSRPITDFGISMFDVYYVDSVNGDDGRSGRSVSTSLATLDAAVGKCTANQGDIIYLMPKHAESRAVTGAIATIDVAGLTIVGLGYGNQIPTFSLGHAGASIGVNAGDIKISNIQALSTVADVAVGITMTALSARSIISNCKLRDSAANKEMLVGISVAENAHGVKILNNNFRTTAAAGSNNAILSGAATELEVRNNTAFGKYATGVMLTSGVLTRADIRGNTFVNAEAAIAIALSGTTSTGILAENRLGGTTSIAAALTGDNAMWCFENYVTGAAGASGILNPAADADA